MSHDQTMRVIYLVVLLVIIGGLGFARGRLEKGKALRQGLIWLAIIVGLMLAYDLMNRTIGTPAPSDEPGQIRDV